jgi:hypothetical protein
MRVFGMARRDATYRKKFLNTIIGAESKGRNEDTCINYPKSHPLTDILQQERLETLDASGKLLPDTYERHSILFALPL